MIAEGTIGPRDYPGGEHLGGSFVFCSKFAHRMVAFHGMEETEQAGVFGRDLTKEQAAKGSDSRIENPKVGVDVKGSHVVRPKHSAVACDAMALFNGLLVISVPGLG